MTVTLDDVQRAAVVRRAKRAHLYPVPRSGEPPFLVGYRHELHRRLPDPDERDGEGVLKEKDPPPPCHVVITKVTEVLLDDLVKADIKALNFERITDVKRWWLDERRPTWRKPYEEADAAASSVTFYGRVLVKPCQPVGAWIGAQEVQDQYERLLGTTTAWLVRWEVDSLFRPGYLAKTCGPTSLRTSPQMRSAGQAVPAEWAQIYTDRGRIADDNRRRQAASKDAKKAVSLLKQVDALFKGEHVPPAEKRRHRSRHRRTMHFLEQDVRGIVERARA